MSLRSSLFRLSLLASPALLAAALAACNGDDSAAPLVGDAGTDTGAKDGAPHDGASDAPHDSAADAAHATDAADATADDDASDGATTD